MRWSTLLVGVLALALCAAALPALAQTKQPLPPPYPNGKSGGVLQAMTRENPPSLSPQEESTISTVWLAMPIFNNLMLYEPYRQTEDSQYVVGELAESWAWSDGGKRLTFKLRRGVKWHDGKPFTAADVKFTLDVARGTSDKRFKLNPRKLWWDNIRDIVTTGDYEVALVLTRPQPSLIAYLANGYTPIYPAHLDPGEMRTRPVGTGPFKLKEFKPDERLVLERNPDYFVKGRPYLDGIVYTVIRSRPSRIAALQAGQVYVSFPNDGTIAARDQLKAAAPGIVVHEVAAGVQENVLLNLKKPPFDNPKIALAVSLALDRPALIRSVHQGAGVLGAANLPPPFGPWGIAAKDLAKLPGYGDAAANKERARKLLAEAGYGPGKPLKVSVGTRAVENYVEMAVWVIDQLRQVGIEGVLEQFETGVWHPKVTRREFQLGTNLTGVAVDDPDGNFFENYSCESSRNYTGYCNPQVEEMMNRQSAELNPAKRLALVQEIDRRLQMESARPILLHRMDYFMHWPFVKNLVPHHNIYSYGRMQDVWLDK
ncbi:MAG TPA: ABC transporter substrate-binding protein [bacterium]